VHAWVVASRPHPPTLTIQAYRGPLRISDVYRFCCVTTATTVAVRVSGAVRFMTSHTAPPGVADAGTSRADAFSMSGAIISVISWTSGNFAPVASPSEQRVAFADASDLIASPEARTFNVTVGSRPTRVADTLFHSCNKERKPSNRVYVVAIEACIGWLRYNAIDAVTLASRSVISFIACAVRGSPVDSIACSTSRAVNVARTVRRAAVSSSPPRLASTSVKSSVAHAVVVAILGFRSWNRSRFICCFYRYSD